MTHGQNTCKPELAKHQGYDLYCFHCNIVLVSPGIQHAIKFAKPQDHTNGSLVNLCEIASATEGHEQECIDPAKESTDSVAECFLLLLFWGGRSDQANAAFLTRKASNESRNDKC